ncbi:MAG: 2-dehydropantoate 2-reductase [Burkholderiales bacterium]|nr:2-dehydropantoate 2-reductase [Burkholderiales bacterium]
MKILIMGSGGLGGLYGGLLARAGCEVTFVARGAHLAALREHGLTIENAARGDIRLPKVSVTDDPAGAGEADFVLIAVKLWDTEAAARAVKPALAPDTAVISLQNGVMKDDILRRELGSRAVMGGVAYVGTHIARPGVIHQAGTLQRLVIGEYDGRRSPRAERLLEAAVRAGLQAELSADIRRAIWEKFVFLVGLSGATATVRAPIGRIRENPRARAFLRELMKEAVRVGIAHGVALPEDYADERLAFADTVPADMVSSLFVDLERGNRLEVEWLAGAVARLGEEKGVATPANRAVWDILALHAAGKT